jgi:hypothetical protein
MMWSVRVDERVGARESEIVAKLKEQGIWIGNRNVV